MKPDFGGLLSVYIHPGEVCFASNPIVVSTVLGSCLSITMFSSKIKYAGISHCQLPNCRSENFDCNNCLEPFKYVNCTIFQMIKKFEQLQIHRNDIEVKIFGGADVFKTSSGEKKESTIGKQNIQTALETLAVNKMNAAVTDVGGVQGRKIIFFTETGEIFLNRLKYNG
jgi:chemotaxis protein CheD